MQRFDFIQKCGCQGGGAELFFGDTHKNFLLDFGRGSGYNEHTPELI